MSDKLLCLFCQQELNYLGEDIYYCPNHQKYMGSEELWQELITTRKALDLAIERMEDIQNHTLAGWIQHDILETFKQIESITKR